jgi:Tol biopolymer transport system component
MRPAACVPFVRCSAALACTVALATGCADEPTRPAEPGSMAPLLARAGEHAGPPLSVAFYSNRDGNAEIYRMDPDGSSQTRITFHAASDIEPDLSPNGKQVVFTSTRSGNADIWMLDLRTGALVNLTNTTAAEGWPRWSPNGKQIAFHSNRDGNFEIYVVNADGTGSRRVTTYSGVDMWPEWSPNGKQLAVRRDMDVYVLDLRSGTAIQLTTHPALDQMAAWSPNGQQLAFMSLREGYCSVFLMNADGSGQVNLTPKDPADPASAWCSRTPSWSTNGRRILFMSIRPGTGGTAEIFSMAADGSDLTRLTFAPGDDGTPTAR